MEVDKAGGDDFFGSGNDVGIEIIREVDSIADFGNGLSHHQDVFYSFFFRPVQSSAFDQSKHILITPLTKIAFFLFYSAVHNLNSAIKLTLSKIGTCWPGRKTLLQGYRWQEIHRPSSI